jgi:hypothetical protein
VQPELELNPVGVVIAHLGSQRALGGRPVLVSQNRFGEMQELIAARSLGRPQPAAAKQAAPMTAQGK